MHVGGVSSADGVRVWCLVAVATIVALVSMVPKVMAVGKAVLHRGLLLLHVRHCGRNLLLGVGVLGVNVVGRLSLGCVGTVHACGLSAKDLSDLFLDAALHGPPIERLRDGQLFVRR